MTLAVMTGPEDGVLEILGEYGVEEMDDEARGKKYGESEVEGVDNDGDWAGKLAGFWFCGTRPDDGVRGAIRMNKRRNLL